VCFLLPRPCTCLTWMLLGKDSLLGMYVMLRRIWECLMCFWSHIVFCCPFGHVSTPFLMWILRRYSTPWSAKHLYDAYDGWFYAGYVSEDVDGWFIRNIGSYKVSTRPLGHVSYPCFVSMIRSSTAQSLQAHLVYTWKGELVLPALVTALTPFSKRCKLPHTWSQRMALTH